MTDTLEPTARLIADRGRDALLARLRGAFADAASAHADPLQLDNQQLEQMVQRAADRADGLQWRRALATVATEELGIGLGEALGHPAVERAQAIVGAPSYRVDLGSSMKSDAAIEESEEFEAAAESAEAAARPKHQAAEPETVSAEPELETVSAEPELDAEHQAEPETVSAAPFMAAEPAPPRSPVARAAASAAESVAGSQTGAAARPKTGAAARPAKAVIRPATEAGARRAAQAPARPTTTGAPARPETEARPTTKVPASHETEARPTTKEAPARPETEGRRTIKIPAGPETVTPDDPVSDAPGTRDGLRIAAIHLGGVTNLRPGEGDIEVRLSEHGLDIARDSSDEILGRLAWSEIESLEVPPIRGFRLRRREPRAHLVVRTEHGDASFEIPAVFPEELREHLEPVLTRHGRQLAVD